MASTRRRAPIGMWGLVAIIFFTVSGGPYGLEPLVGSLGGGRSLALLLAVPVLWSLPVALMSAELSAAMPLLGGYYQWVRRGLGEFWGFQEGWWSWLFTWVDMPLYPVLCGEILRESWPLFTGRTLSAAHTALFALGFIWAAALLHAVGTRVTTAWSLAAAAAVLAPFVAFAAAAARAHPGAAAAAGPGLAPAGWAVGLSTVMWNYAGWDNVSTFAPDVAGPQRVYPRALGAGLGLITLFYVASVAAGLHLDPVAAHWRNGYFVILGGRVLGPGVAAVMAATALLSAWTQYTAQLLYVLPLPASLALDGYLPAALARVNARGVRPAALVACSAIFSLFALASFSRLVVADVLLYSSGLALEFAALLLLRRRAGGKAAFQIPLRGWGLAGMCALPLLLAAINLGVAAKQDPLFSLIAVALLASGPLVWLLLRARAAAEADWLSWRLGRRRQPESDG
ncbi:MAG TPA: APC family permease [Terriglobales bacterium]|nr:APC family permease [Terriglobales bacterium]